jgi:hypothetical protein
MSKKIERMNAKIRNLQQTLATVRQQEADLKRELEKTVQEKIQILNEEL